MNRQKPLSKRDRRILKNRADTNRELLPAMSALPKPDARFSKIIDTISSATVRTYRPIRPAQSFNHLKRFGFISGYRGEFGKVHGVTLDLCDTILYLAFGFVKQTIAEIPIEITF